MHPAAAPNRRFEAIFTSHCAEITPRVIGGNLPRPVLAIMSLAAAARLRVRAKAGEGSARNCPQAGSCAQI
jgi:hypothetical protein